MAEKNIELDSVEVAAAVFGNCDRNIRLLEHEFSVTAVYPILWMKMYLRSDLFNLTKMCQLIIDSSGLTWNS